MDCVQRDTDDGFTIKFNNEYLRKHAETRVKVIEF